MFFLFDNFPIHKTRLTRKLLFRYSFLISGRSCTTIKVSFSSIWFSLEISFQEEEDEAKKLNLLFKNLYYTFW